MLTQIETLKSRKQASAEDLKALLLTTDTTAVAHLHAAARSVAEVHFGKKVFLRGLIEISNFCKNNCFYCGIRRSNRELKRYRLSQEEVLDCCEEGYRLGFRTFVLQGGKDPSQTDVWVEELVRSIRIRYPEVAITLSLGEKSKETYERWFAAGANRYLLRHESYNAAHYASLHPKEMSREKRLNCLEQLKTIGYQTGTGIMVGSPEQSIDNIVEDLLFLSRLRPEMIGLGPFISHHATPFALHKNGSLDLTLRILSICRLLFPNALIPSTTALASLPEGGGRTKGILAGANVIMPNLSPSTQRQKYQLYDDKACMGSEAAEGLLLLQEELSGIGYQISMLRGDYIPETGPTDIEPKYHNYELQQSL